VSMQRALYLQSVFTELAKCGRSYGGILEPSPSPRRPIELNHRWRDVGRALLSAGRERQ
jgi:hypothetical protein